MQKQAGRQPLQPCSLEQWHSNAGQKCLQAMDGASLLENPVAPTRICKRVNPFTLTESIRQKPGCPEARPYPGDSVLEPSDAP